MTEPTAEEMVDWMDAQITQAVRRFSKSIRSWRGSISSKIYTLITDLALTVKLGRLIAKGEMPLTSSIHEEK